MTKLQQLIEAVSFTSPEALGFAKKDSNWLNGFKNGFGKAVAKTILDKGYEVYYRKVGDYDEVLLSTPYDDQVAKNLVDLGGTHGQHILVGEFAFNRNGRAANKMLLSIHK